MKPIMLPPPGPVPEVVALARQILEAAERGELVALGFVGVHVGRADGNGFEVGSGSIAGLVLGCERLKKRLLELGE